MNLSDLVARDPEVARVVLDLSVSNREVGRRFGYNESVVRRYRARAIADPVAMATRPVTQVEGTAQWTPGVDLSDDTGEIRTLPAPSESPVPDDADALLEAGVNPDDWEITNRYESRWQAADGSWKTSRKLTLKKRKTKDVFSEKQITEILTAYRGDRSLPYAKYGLAGDGIFVAPIGDIQVGKVDGGGTAALLDRFADYINQAKNRLLTAGGARLLLIPVLGDCIEGIVAMNGKMITRLDLSVTEQVRVYRRLLMHAICELSPYATEVIVTVLPGNHDENWRAQEMPVTDSWAIEGASAVEDALAMSGDYKKVRFIYPQSNELVITLNVGTEDKPFIIGMTHGHLAKSANGFEAWWGKQSFGRQHGGRADLMLSAHFHHLRIERLPGNRTWIQIPAMDGGSDYYRRSQGAGEASGMVTFWVTPGAGFGWRGLTVHSA